MKRPITLTDEQIREIADTHSAVMRCYYHLSNEE